MDSTLEFGVWTHLISEGITDQARDFLRVYLPRIKFNGRYVCRQNGLIYIKNIEQAIDLTGGFHPAWSRLNSNMRRLMARNAFQVLGKDLASPVHEVLCWTPDGSLGDKTTHDTGGTGQALRIAYANKIPVLNAANPTHERYLKQLTANIKLPFKLTHTHLKKFRGYHEVNSEHFFKSI